MFRLYEHPPPVIKSYYRKFFFDWNWKHFRAQIVRTVLYYYWENYLFYTVRITHVLLEVRITLTIIIVIVVGVFVDILSGIRPRPVAHSTDHHSDHTTTVWHPNLNMWSGESDNKDVFMYGYHVYHLLKSTVWTRSSI